jgi:hypothetical protein
MKTLIAHTTELAAPAQPFKRWQQRKTALEKT